MKTFFTVVAFFLIFDLVITDVNSQADSCSSNLNLNGQIPFDTSSLQCNPVWDAQNFILRYSKAGSNVWSFVLSAPNPNSYIAIGFSPDGKMVGSSAIVGWVGPNSGPVMKRYFLGGQSPGQVRVDQGNLDVLSNSSTIVSAVSSRVYMAFQLNTDQPETRLIYSVGSSGRFPSGPPEYRLFQHSDMVSTSLNYATGESQTQSRSYSNLKKSHGALSMVGWGILMLIGAMAARHLKQWDPIWFYSHIAIQSLAFAFGIAGVICGFVLEDKLSADVDKHKSLGIVILILGSLQVMAFLARPDKASKVRKYWNWYHHNVGRLVIVLAAVNVFYGIDLGDAGSGWNAGYGVVLALLLLLAILLELRLWMRK